MSLPTECSSNNEPHEKRSDEVTTEQWMVLNGRVTESSQQIGMLRKTIQELIRSMDAERTLAAAVQQTVRELDAKLTSETQTRSVDVRGLCDALRAETAARLELTAIEEGFWSTAQDRSTRLEDRAAKMEDLLKNSLERCSIELSREKEAREQLAMELHESLGRTLALSGQVYDLRTAHEGRFDQNSESHDALQERLLALEKNHKQDMAKCAEEIEELRMKVSEDRPTDERTERLSGPRQTTGTQARPPLVKRFTLLLLLSWHLLQSAEAAAGQHRQRFCQERYTPPSGIRGLAPVQRHVSLLVRCLHQHQDQYLCLPRRLGSSSRATGLEQQAQAPW